MSESLIVVEGTKTDKYQSLLPQVEALMEGETDFIANMSNLCAALKAQFGWLWVGFYLLREEMLVLGPFQGPIACTRISKGRGVCGTCWQRGETIIVDDVEKFPGHIACSSLSKSEIVVPVFSNEKFLGVLDVDSERLSEFDETDKKFLEKMVTVLTRYSRS